jgi:dephospho-CoA kinase
MKVIGLTGGIGSGKSTVARFLAELGAVTLDLDQVGHEVLKQADVREKLTAEFGRGILDSRGEVVRAKLGRLVFNNGDILARLNRITHPAIDAVVRAKLEEQRRRGTKAVVLEAAAILEAEKTAGFDELWVTVAPEDVALERLAGRGGLSRQEALERLRSQLSNEERLRQADVVIDTDCSLDELKEKVAAEWHRLLERL